MEIPLALKRLLATLNKEKKMDLPSWARPKNWMKNAVATNRGWVNEKTGEVYKKHSNLKDKIDALAPAKPAPKPKPKPAPAPKDEGVDLSSMTKDELEELGREHGIELDKRKTKKDLVAEIKDAI